MDAILKFIGSLIGPDKVGSFVRKVVVGGLTLLVGYVAQKFEFVTQIVSPEVIDGIAIAVAAGAVTLWSNIVKA